MSIKDENDGTNKALTLGLIHEIGGFKGSTTGTKLIARFCNAVNQGETPLGADLKVIADALEPLMTFYLIDSGTTDNRLRDQLDVFARRMGLKKKQGREREHLHIDSVTQYFEKRDEFIHGGDKESEATSKALDWSSKQEKISPRAMRNRIVSHKEAAEMMYSFKKECAPMVEQYKRFAEMEENLRKRWCHLSVVKSGK